MIVSAIQNEVILRLGAGARTSAANLLNAIDEGNKRIYNKLVKTHERLFYGTASFNAILDRNEYTVSDGVPSNIKRILKVETRYADQSVRVPATKIDLINIRKMDEISVTYQNKLKPRYTWFGNGVNTVLAFFPTHDEAGDNYNKLWYLKKPTDITDGSQTPVSPDDSHFLIVEFALAVAQLMEDEDKAGYIQMLNRFDKDLEEWIESEYPATSEPKFTQDVEE